MTRLLLILSFLLYISAGHAVSQWENYRGDRQLTGRTTVDIPTRVKIEWVFQTEDAIKASPVVSGNRIVIGSTDGYIYCLNMQGGLEWKYNTEYAIEGSAMILNDIVYVGNLRGTLMALELATGKLLWKYETDNQIMAAPTFWSDGQKTYILVGAYDFYLHCVDAANGNGIWKYEAMNYLHSVVAIEGNNAIFGGCDGLLHVVDIRNGKALAGIEIASYVASPSAVENGLVYVGDYDGQVSCVDYGSKKSVGAFKRLNANCRSLVLPRCLIAVCLLVTVTGFCIVLTKRPAKCSGM
jgi:eukaryotic-like serine/threonine-protein kinase